MTTYRTDDRPGLKAYSMRELDGCGSIYTPAARPQDDRQPLGEWYCTNQDCTVREVWITAKLIECDDRLPDPNCPACGKPLKFHHWLHVSTMLKVSDE